MTARLEEVRVPPNGALLGPCFLQADCYVSLNVTVGCEVLALHNRHSWIRKVAGG